ncbi:MAG: prepilin-type N-terminal cleavage/methylation domain-containing protein [Labilithrix sp.]|nr:prepilin-type N-terminal cleavage/methylation domain-containing protein [Labilithrix sp.]
MSRDASHRRAALVAQSHYGRRHRARRSAGGFTLVELMISLVMGLIVALAAVGLSRTATTTFYEQARISGVEANVRTASERFRNDLSRVSFMSSPNIRFDRKVAAPPDSEGVPYRVVPLQNLQGIYVETADDVRSHPFSGANNLNPQRVFVAGNLTTNDVYRGVFTRDGATGAACGAGGAEVRLDGLADPAVRRLFNGEPDAAGRQHMTQLAFMPGERMNPPVTGVEYAVQVMDMRGCFHYMTICRVDADATQPETVVLQLSGDAARGILTPSDTGGDVCGARIMEEVAVAPIQRVRWSLGVENEPRRIDTVLEGTGGTAPDKFNLYRQLLAADGTTPVGPPELIAEYGIDLKLGLIVDSGMPGAPATTNIDFEDPSADALFAQWAGPVSAATLPNVGPHRIRSVRYRLAFRTAFPDRRGDLPMPGGPPYLSRYRMNGNDYARVRTVISEVALFNQAKVD